MPAFDVSYKLASECETKEELMMDDSKIRHTFVYLENSDILDNYINYVKITRDNQLIFDQGLDDLIRDRISSGTINSDEVLLLNVKQMPDVVAQEDLAQEDSQIIEFALSPVATTDTVTTAGTKEEKPQKNKAEYLAVYIKESANLDDGKWATKARVLLIINGYIYAEYLGKKCFDAITGTDLSHRWQIVSDLTSLPKHYAISEDFSQTIPNKENYENHFES
jgi:hypothetical protein